MLATEPNMWSDSVCSLFLALVLGMEHLALGMLGQCLTIGLHPQPSSCSLFWAPTNYGNSLCSECLLTASSDSEIAVLTLWALFVCFFQCVLGRLRCHSVVMYLPSMHSSELNLQDTNNNNKKKYTFPETKLPGLILGKVLWSLRSQSMFSKCYRFHSLTT